MSRLVTSVKEVIVGFVVGIAATLPGISGATLLVIFRIYERIIRDLAALRVWLRKDFAFLFLVAAGIVIGTVVSAKLLNTFMDSHPGWCMMLFVGLILGQIPAVYLTTGLREDRTATPGQWAALAAGLAVMVFMIAVDLSGMGGGDIVVGSDPEGYLLMIVAGLIFAIAALLPGISHSTLFIVFGLFTAFTAAVGDLIMDQVGALALGILIGVLAFSKIIHHALDTHHRAMMFLIFGLTVGSLLYLICSSAEYLGGIGDIAVALVFLAIGFIVSIRFMRLGEIEEE